MLFWYVRPSDTPFNKAATTQNSVTYEKKS